MFREKRGSLLLCVTAFAGAALLIPHVTGWKPKAGLKATYAAPHLLLPSDGDALTSVSFSETGPSEDELGLPLAGLRASDLRDSFYDPRDAGYGTHEALDIEAPRGTPVLAMTTGSVKKLFTSKPGGLTVYQFDRAEVYCFYYAHLDRYAASIAEGMVLRRGEILGYVGSTGNANPSNPHLHLEISRLGADKRWWKGTPINPFPLLQRLLQKP